MNLPSPYSENELDRLVRGTLNARIGAREPPEYIWQQIRARLKTEDPSPHRLPPVMQSALTTLLVVILVGVILRMRLISDDVAHILSFNLTPFVATVYVDEYSASPGVMYFSNESDVGSLRTFSQLRAEQQIAAVPKSYPPGMVPLDVTPQPASVERRSSSSPPHEGDVVLSLRTLLTTDGSTARSGHTWGTSTGGSAMRTGEFTEVRRSLEEPTAYVFNSGQRFEKK